MPEDLYGEGTDQVLPLLFDPARKYRNIRPRCINSGMIMGTMGGLRQALGRCKRKIETVARSGRQLWSDQALLAEVVGEQEMWREWMRELETTWDGDISKYDFSKLGPEMRTIAAKALTGEQFEFGIGLDYNFTTIPATCSSEDDGSFIKFSDENAMREASLKAGVPNGPRIATLPEELKNQNQVDNGKGPLSNILWGNVPLYTDLFFGVSPVGIHHNAYINGLKPKRLKQWWNLMWFYPLLRDLVTAQLDSHETTMPLLNMPSRQDGKADVSYWPPGMQRHTKQVTVFEPATADKPAKLAPIDWDGVCQKGRTPWYDELFGDDKGPLRIQ